MAFTPIRESARRGLIGSSGNNMRILFTVTETGTSFACMKEPSTNRSTLKPKLQRTLILLSFPHIPNNSERWD